MQKPEDISVLDDLADAMLQFEKDGSLSPSGDEELVLKQAADIARERGITERDIENAFFPTLTAHIQAEVRKAVLLNMPIALDGPAGCGKTSSVYRVARDKGWRVFYLNASMDLAGNEELRNRILDMVRTRRQKLTIIFLDELENIQLPRKRYKIKRKGKKEAEMVTYMELLGMYVQRYGRRNKVALVAACNDGWELAAKSTWFTKVFNHYKVRAPAMYKILAAFRDRFGIELPDDAPADLRYAKSLAISMILGIPRPEVYNVQKDSFRLFREFFAAHPSKRVVPDSMRPGLEHWVVANLFAQGPKSIFYSNEDPFWKIISLLSVADVVGDDVLKMLPQRQFKRWEQFKHPSTIKKKIPEIIHQQEVELEE